MGVKSHSLLSYYLYPAELEQVLMPRKPTYEELETKVKELEEEAAKHKGVEQALNKSEERYPSIIETINDPVYICSPDYRVAYMNHAMIKRIGRKAKGEPCYKSIYERSEKCPWCVHDKIQQGELCQTELVSPRDGRFYHVSHFPIFHTDGSTSKMTIFRDLNELKQAQETLREGEERYLTLAEHVADGVTIVQEGKLLFVNHAFCSMFGYGGPKQIIGKKIDDLIFDAFHQCIKEIYRSFESDISSGKTFQATCHEQDGRELWVEGHHVVTKWKGKPALITTIRDITESRLQDIASQDEVEHLQGESTTLRFSMKDGYRFGNIVGKSQSIQQVYNLISMAATSNASVVIGGESGTGKELVAQAIHEMSNRRDRAFVSVNCGAMPEALLESEFFGYKKGAFTGAYTDKHGYLDLADGGTLFLDELGEVSLGMQVKLLRAIDGGGYTPVGSTQSKDSDFRIIAASNGNLMDLMRKRLIREDFFYRIHVISITVPPLRDRKEDIPLLIDHFLRLYGKGKERADIPGGIMQSLLDYHWPGNVRELQNVLQRYLTVKRLELMSPIGVEPDYLNGNSGENLDLENLDFHQAMEKFQKNVIVRALEQTQWNKGKAASMLSIDRKTLFRKMKSFGLS